MENELHDTLLWEHHPWILIVVVTTVLLAIFIQQKLKIVAITQETKEPSLNEKYQSRLLTEAAAAKHNGEVGKRPAVDFIRNNVTQEIAISAANPQFKKVTDLKQSMNEIKQQTQEKNAPAKNLQRAPGKKTRFSETVNSHDEQALANNTTLTFVSTTDTHPGLDAFWYWLDIEASLFRIYCRGRTDGMEEVPPYNPSSRRGVVPIRLRVTNNTANIITACWVDFKGKEIDKGDFGPDESWFQTTWVDHPWVFRRKEDGAVLLHYIPYRVIPTTEHAPTTDPENPDNGLHQFTIHEGVAPYECSVDDPVLPFPAQDYLRTLEQAIEFSLLHCHRMGYNGWNMLHTYLIKIVDHPEETKYRQIRTANRNFAQTVWMTQAKGLMFALGFVEHEQYAELGTRQVLSEERVLVIKDVLAQIVKWQHYAESGEQQTQQPVGACER